MMKSTGLTVAAAGDILITKRIPEGNEGADSIRRFMLPADARLANLETTVTDGRCYASAYSGGTWLTTDPACLEDLKLYGFDYLGLANNHMMDYSYEGLRQTLENVRRAGFACGGAGESLGEASRPEFLETGNGRVAVISICSTLEPAAAAGNSTHRMPGRPGINPLRFSRTYHLTKEHTALLKELAERTGINVLHEHHRAQGFFAPLPEGVSEFGPVRFDLAAEEKDEGSSSAADPRDVERTAAAIREARITSEVVIVMLHSHEILGDREDTPDSFAEDFARTCIDAGADAVIGSGTHQLKGIELYRGRPIFYGLGNFIFENEYVRDLPADYMEKYGLDPETTAAEGIRARTERAARSLYSMKEVYQTVVPRFVMKNGKCLKIELLPVSLGFGKKGYLKNLPAPATDAMTEEILRYVNRASARYNLRFTRKGSCLEADI